MSNEPKTFDAVETMRSIRDSISSKIENMTWEEEHQWLSSQKLKDPLLQRLQKKSIQQNNATSNAIAQD